MKKIDESCEMSTFTLFMNVMSSLMIELRFEQKFKLDSRVGQIGQLNPRVEQLELEETELVSYKFLGFEQKILFKPESWTEILVQPEDWIESSCSTCLKPNSAITLIMSSSIVNVMCLFFIKLLVQIII
jgi:hypothetical protein